MQNCDKCKIKIRGAKRACPLCGNDLSGTPEPDTAGYPTLQNKVSKWSVIKVAVFCFVVTEIIFYVMRYLTKGAHPWMVLVMIWAAVGLIDLMIVVYYRHNPLKLLTWQVYIGMVLSVIIDRKMTGWHGWSLAWLLPCTFVGLAILTICIGRARHMMLMEYIIYLAAAVLFSLIQMLFIHIGWNPFPLPAVISIALMLILGAAGLLFFFREFRSAASRMFHM